MYAAVHATEKTHAQQQSKKERSEKAWREREVHTARDSGAAFTHGTNSGLACSGVQVVQWARWQWFAAVPCDTAFVGFDSCPACVMYMDSDGGRVGVSLSLSFFFCLLTTTCTTAAPHPQAAPSPRPRAQESPRLSLATAGHITQHPTLPFACDHTTENAPDPVRSPKLSSVGLT